MFRTIGKSPTLLINEQSRLQEMSGREVFKLGFGQSPFLPPDHAQEALKTSVNRNDYTPVSGLEELCTAAAEFHTHHYGISIDPSQILVGSGSKILIYNTFLAFEQADVLIPAPSWVSYAPQVELIGHKAHMLKTSFEGQWKISPDGLREVLRECDQESKVLILNYPSNPTGLTYNAQELKALADVLKQHEVWVICDEIYGVLDHKGAHRSLAEFYPERTLVTTSISKWCAAGGWRLGIEILPQTLPDNFRTALVGIASETYSCAPTPIQVAGCAAYQLIPETEAYINQQRHILSFIGNYIQQQLDRAGIRVHPPQGGFYLMVDFLPFAEQLKSRGIAGDADLCRCLLEETGVALLPGSAFGMPAESMAARLAYVDFNGAALMQQDGQASNDEMMLICAHMMRGIDRLCDWTGQL